MGIPNARCPPRRTGDRPQTSSGADADDSLTLDARGERDWDRTIARRSNLAAARSIGTTNSGSRTLATGAAAASNAADVGDRLPGNDFTGADSGATNRRRRSIRPRDGGTGECDTHSLARGCPSGRGRGVGSAGCVDVAQTVRDARAASTGRRDQSRPGDLRT